MTVSSSYIRSLIGVTRISAKMSLIDLCQKICVGISNRNYEGSYPWYLYSSASGILHGIQTGRIDSSRADVLERLSGKSAVSFILSITDKELTGDDVSRFCNGRAFSHNGTKWVPVYQGTP